MISKFLLFILIFTSSSAYSQMFSVGGESGQQARISSNYFRLGFSPVIFEFDGSNSSPTQSRLDFESAAATFFFESPAISASLSFVNGLTGAEDERYLNLSIDYLNRLNFFRSRAFQFGIPFGLNSNLVNVQNEQMNDDFSQTVFAFGLGGFMVARVPEKISFSLEGVPSYGFSNSRGGLFGGSNKSFLIRSRLDFLNLIKERNLSLGYDYKFSSYDLDADEFDYDLTYHRITLGISL